MTRNDFLDKAMRYLLMLALAVIVFALGRKVAYGKDCSMCPEAGACPKDFDCTK